MITVLMYHAVPDDASDPRGADPHYSVSKAQFDRHLALFRANDALPASVLQLLAAPAGSSRSRLAMTFDDGHGSNFHAAERLHAIGGAADFFVNPSTVGTPDYLSWAQLRQMAAWGMSIQSHGMHHHLLNDLPPAQVRSELVDSKRAIEEALGLPVTLFAPPGGRVVPGLQELAGELGYRKVCSSRVDLWDAGAPVGTHGVPADVPRLAVLQQTADAQLARWVRQSAWEIGLQRTRYRALGAAKRMLGNGAYQRLREAALARRAG